jgi:ribosome-binding ATPase YchF (GTP1/OBG family)
VEGDNELSLKFKEYMKKKEPNASIVCLSAQAEEEASHYKNEGKTDKEKERMFYEYLKEYGLNDTKIKDLTNECSKKLKLSMFYTAGKKQVASWLIPEG